ncbi:MAG: hypothetical protein ACRDQ2_16215 [Gaiellales bacterium]
MVLVSDATLDDCTAAAARRRCAAERYRPDRVRLLLVAQTPPEELDRYFYFPSVPKADYLFQAVVPHLLGEVPARLDKRAQLGRLRDMGVYLNDLKADPCDPREPAGFVDDLVRRAGSVRPERAVLIKVDVYDAAFHRLCRAGVPVIDKRMPFPSTGRQREFSRGFADALALAGWASLAEPC